MQWHHRQNYISAKNNKIPIIPNTSNMLTKCGHESCWNDKDLQRRWRVRWLDQQHLQHDGASLRESQRATRDPLILWGHKDNEMWGWLINMILLYATGVGDKNMPLLPSLTQGAFIKAGFMQGGGWTLWSDPCTAGGLFWRDQQDRTWPPRASRAGMTKKQSMNSS